MKLTVVKLTLLSQMSIKEKSQRTHLSHTNWKQRSVVLSCLSSSSEPQLHLYNLMYTTYNCGQPGSNLIPNWGLDLLLPID